MQIYQRFLTKYFQTEKNVFTTTMFQFQSKTSKLNEHNIRILVNDQLLSPPIRLTYSLIIFQTFSVLNIRPSRVEQKIVPMKPFTPYPNCIDFDTFHPSIQTRQAGPSTHSKLRQNLATQRPYRHPHTGFDIDLYVNTDIDIILIGRVNAYVIAHPRDYVDAPPPPHRFVLSFSPLDGRQTCQTTCAGSYINACDVTPHNSIG